MIYLPGHLRKDSPVGHGWFWRLREIAQEVHTVSLETGLKRWASLEGVLVEVQSTGPWEDPEVFVRDAMQVPQGEEYGLIRVKMLPRRGGFVPSKYAPLLLISISTGP